MRASILRPLDGVLLGDSDALYPAGGFGILYPGALDSFWTNTGSPSFDFLDIDGGGGGGAVFDFNFDGTGPFLIAALTLAAVFFSCCLFSFAAVSSLINLVFLFMPTKSNPFTVLFRFSVALVGSIRLRLDLIAARAAF
jgi:hypothetical protein